MVERLAIHGDLFLPIHRSHHLVQPRIQHGLNLPRSHDFQSAIKGGLTGHFILSGAGIDPTMQGAPLRFGQSSGVVVKGAVSAWFAGEFGASDDGKNRAQAVAFTLAFAAVAQAVKAFQEAGQMRGGNAALNGQWLFILAPRLG